MFDITLVNSCHRSGTLSTVFLWLVDVPKSRKECAEFIAAEAKREAFNMGKS